MRKNNINIYLILLAGALLTLAAVSPKMGLRNAYLLSDLNGNSKGMTNLSYVYVGLLLGDLHGSAQNLTNVWASGTGEGSLQLGEGATAVGTGTIAIGYNSGAGPTNGAIALGNETGATGPDSLALGTMASASEWDASALGAGASAAHIGSTAIGALAGTTADRQIRLGTDIDTVSVPGKMETSGSVTATNGWFSFNGTYQPANAHGSLMLVGDETVDISAAGQSVFLQLTNYDALVTNLFNGSIADGTLTNTYAGWYNIRVSASGLGTTANAQLYECAVHTNLVECPLITWHRSVSSQAHGSMAAEGTIFLPAGTRVDVRIKSDLASPDDFTYAHQVLTVSSP